MMSLPQRAGLFIIEAALRLQTSILPLNGAPVLQVQLQIHWNPSTTDFFVKAKSSTIEGLSTHDRVFVFSENPIGQA